MVRMTGCTPCHTEKALEKQDCERAGRTATIQGDRKCWLSELARAAPAMAAASSAARSGVRAPSACRAAIAHTRLKMCLEDGTHSLCELRPTDRGKRALKAAGATPQVSDTTQRGLVWGQARPGGRSPPPPRLAAAPARGPTCSLSSRIGWCGAGWGGPPPAPRRVAAPAPTCSLKSRVGWCRAG